MNRVYKVIWSKTKNCYVVVSEFAHAHSKAKKSVLTAAVLASFLATGSGILPTAYAEENPKTGTNYVVYDDSDASTVTLEDNTGDGTKVTNVKAGDLAAASKDAVNGSQLYETNRNVSELSDALTKNNTTIAQAQTDITRIKTKNLTLESNLNTVITQVTTGWNATIDGAKVKTINPSDNSLNFSVGKDISLTDPGNGSILVAVDSSKGVIAAGNTNVVNGGTVYTALSAEQTAREAADTTLSNKIGVIADGNYIKAADSVGTNLSTLDTQVKTNADAIAKETSDRTASEKTINDTISSLSDSAVQYDKDSNKGKVTLAGADGTTITNLKDGALSETSKDAVTGKQLYAEQQARDAADTAINNKIGTTADGNYVKAADSIGTNLGTLDTQVKANADAISKGIQGLTDTGLTLSDGTNTGVAKLGSTVAVTGDSKNVTTALTQDEKGNTTLKVTMSDNPNFTTITTTGDTHIGGNLTVDGTTNLKGDTTVEGNTTFTKNVTMEGDTTVKNLKLADGTNLNNAVTYDSDTKDAITLKGADGTTITNLKDGALSETSKDAVTGKQLYAEQQARDAADTAINNKIGTTADGNYVKAADSVGTNLGTLDTQVKTNADAIAKETSDRTASEKTINDTISSLSDSAVQYDKDSNKGKVTLAGADGTTITNLKDGALSETSKDAVTGKQLYAEQQARDAADTAINNKIGTTADGNYVKAADSVGTNLGTLDTQVKTNADAIAKETKDRTDAITNITNNIGDLSDAAVKYDKDSNKTKITLAGEGGTTITNLKDGVLSDTSTDAITGKQLFAEQQARETAIQNLRDNVVLYDGAQKDIVTFAGSKGTRLTNLKDARLTSSSTDAVTGRQLYATNQNISGFAADIKSNASNISNLSKSVSSSLDSVAAMSDSFTALDNTKADASLNNLSAAGKQVISNAATEAVQAYMKSLKTTAATDASASNSTASTAAASSAKTNTNTLTVKTADLLSSSLVANKKAAPMALAASLLDVTPTASSSTTTNYVTYDDGDTSTVTLEPNADGKGTKLTNVKAGDLAAASLDAVNGSQLYQTNRDVSELSDALSKVNNVAAQAQTDITRIKTQNLGFNSSINTLKEQVTTGWNATVDGAKVKTINPDSNYINFTSGKNVGMKIAENGSIEVSVKDGGKVASGSSELVTGDAVYQAIKDIPTSASLAGKADTSLDNITDAGRQVIKDTVKDSLDGKANTSLDNITDAGKQVIKDTMKDELDQKADKTAVNEALAKKADKDAVDAALATKANTDASNIDVDAYSEKLGVGKNEKGNKGLINGDTLNQAVENINTSISGKADTDLSNITDAGKQVVKDLAQNSVKVVNGKNTTVTEGMDNGTKTFAVNVDNQAIKDAVKDDLDKKADKTQVAEDLAKKANTDASNIDVDAFTKKLGTGTIAEDSTGLVTGSTVYQAIKDMPTGEGLVKRDGDRLTVDKDGTATSVDFHGKDGVTRTLTGVATDASDATSAANVGYVNDTVDQAVNDVGNRLTKDINRVGAGAAALAALHPGDFDPDNKLEFSAGFGHYRGSNAAAVAAYYHPNEDTLFNIGTTLGNGSPMVSAGVTVKFGPGGGKNTLSRTALTHQIANDQDKIKNLEGELGAMKDQMQKMARLMDMLNLDPSKKASFKDVPADHWAKDAVDTLAGNGVVEGYGDGEFKGDRNMTRYEYAEMLYKALQNGQKIDQKVIHEYAPELQKIHAAHTK